MRRKTVGCFLKLKASLQLIAFSLFIILGFLAMYFIARARALTNQEMTLL